MSAERDPIARLRARLLGDGSSAEELEAVERQAEERVAAWMEAARARPMPELSTLREDLFV